MTTDAEIMTGLRELIGDSAIERLSGLDRRTIRRVAAGETDLYQETASRLHSGLVRAAGLLCPTPLPAAAPNGGPDSEAFVRDLIARNLPSAPPLVTRTALILAARSPIRLPDLCEAVTGDRNASGPNVAVRLMADSGLVSITKAPTGRGRVVAWEGHRRV